MRIAMVVPNPCAPDFRVQKEAETLASVGHEVCVFCTSAPSLPVEAMHAGVRYRRLDWQPRPPLALLRHMLWPTRSATSGTRETGVATPAVPAAPPSSGRLARLIGRRPSAVLRRWVRNRVQTIYQPYLEAGFAQVFAPALAAFAADAIHAHDLTALPVAADVARRTGARLLFDSHELEAHRNPPLTRARRRQVERMEARLLPEAAVVLTVGDRIADHLARRYGIARPLVIYNAPRMADRRRHHAPGDADLRSLAGAPEHALVLAYTGNIAPNRGLEDAVAALGLLRRRGGDAPGGRPVCVIAMGRCPPALATELAEQACREGVGDRLFLLPPVAPQEVSDRIASADAALIPIVPLALSYDYAMPNKLFEAIMAGLPVLGSDLAEMGDFLRRGGFGATFRPGDPQALADAISSAFPDGRCILARPDADAIAALSWEAQAAKLVTVYDRLDRGVQG